LYVNKYIVEAIFTFKNIVLLIGGAQGIFLAVVLMTVKKGNIHANSFLAFSILAFSCVTISDFLSASHLLLQVPHFLLVFEPLIFVLAPFSYFYVKPLTDPAWKFKLKHAVHFFPTMLVYLTFSFIYFRATRDKINLIIDEYLNPDLSIDFFSVIAAIQSLVYLVSALKRLQSHTQNIQNYFSYQESVNLRWLKHFMIINCGLWIVFAISAIFRIKLIMDINDFLFPVAVYLIGYFGLKQPTIFFFELPESGENQSPKDPAPKYAGSSLTGDSVQKYSAKLVQMMQDEQLYLINDLKLPDIADKMSLPLHQLSQVINHSFQKNFNDFVNEYRVAEFKQRLIQPDYAHLTILAIGLDSGFNSKAAMNAVFKKHTGLSPSQYRTKK